MSYYISEKSRRATMPYFYLKCTKLIKLYQNGTSVFFRSRNHEFCKSMKEYVKEIGRDYGGYSGPRSPIRYSEPGDIYFIVQKCEFELKQGSTYEVRLQSVREKRQSGDGYYDVLKLTEKPKLYVEHVDGYIDIEKL